MDGEWSGWDDAFVPGVQTHQNDEMSDEDGAAWSGFDSIPPSAVSADADVGATAAATEKLHATDNDADDTASSAAVMLGGSDGQQLRKRGRPCGTFGSAQLRKLQKAAHEKSQQHATAQLPQPGSIEYARAHRRKPQQATNPEMALLAAGSSVNSLIARQSNMWTCMADLGLPIQQGLVAAAFHSIDKQSSKEREQSDVAEVLSLKVEAVMSDKALRAALSKAGASGRADVARCTNLAACASLLAGGIMWGSCLEALRKHILAGRMRGILFAEKMKYDETPLKVRIRDDGREANRQSQALQSAKAESCNHAKVMQFDYSVHVLVQECSSSRFFLLSGAVPSMLQTCDRQTAECILRCIENARSVVPAWQALAKECAHRTRVAVPLAAFDSCLFV